MKSMCVGWSGGTLGGGVGRWGALSHRFLWDLCVEPIAVASWATGMYKPCHDGLVQVIGMCDALKSERAIGSCSPILDHFLWNA
eukprot:1160309-Pelagomonas_calceolata.AAC.4